MKTLYARMVDKLVSPELEKKFRLGRRYKEERRLRNRDRRNSDEDYFLYGQSERRNLEHTRRRPGENERRQRWFRINSFQSRHHL